MDVLFDRQGIDGIEPSIDETGRSRSAVAGKMEAVIISRAEAGHDHAPFLVALGQAAISQQCFQVKFFPFDDKSVASFQCFDKNNSGRPLE